MRRNCSSSDHFHHTPVWDICHRKNRQIYKPKGKEKEKWKLEKKRGRGVVSGVFGFHCFQFSFTVSASHSWHLHTDGCRVHKASTTAQDLPGLRSAWTHGQRWEIKVIEQSHCQQRRTGGGGREVVGREEDGGRNKVEGGAEHEWGEAGGVRWEEEEGEGAYVIRSFFVSLHWRNLGLGLGMLTSVV